MKNLNLIVWITQLGLSTALPPAGFIWLGVFLKNRFNTGAWVVVLFALIGIACGINGLRFSLKAMERLAADDKKKKDKPPVSFNEHD